MGLRAGWGGLFVCLMSLKVGLAFAGPRIVLDPGHGGEKEGARGPNGLVEKSLCLALAQQLSIALEKSLGAEVKLTRGEDVDVSLPQRVSMANAFHPDLFISLHANSMPTRRLRAHAQGLQVFFLSADASGDAAQKTADRENDDASKPGASKRTPDTLSFILADLKRSESHTDSSRLAYAVHRRLLLETHAKDGGVQQAPLYVLMGLEAPALLVEVGFISHPGEAQRLKSPSYQRRLVAGMAQGIADFLKQMKLRERPAAAWANPSER